MIAGAADPVLIAIRCPLVTVWTAAAALGKSTTQIIRMVESGELRWCFNLASPGAERRSVRILTASVGAVQSAQARVKRSEESEWQEVFRQILPPSSARPGIVPTIRACELMTRLLICEKSAAIFIEAGLLKVARAASATTGVNSSPFITVASAQALLRARRIT
jgi:hypothetical protein